ncbi:hypothetical protein EDB19DRAFT_53110 [Suillus lakei]|nr:hypothetical protein EDB19DRAFT_53110 [Suillus lakei]
MKVTLLNFEKACCLKDKGIDEVPGCDQEALAREMQQVKYLISYTDARLIETEIITVPQASSGEQQPLDLDDYVRWLKHVENTHTIPIDMRNRPLPNDGRRRPKKLKVKAVAISQRESAGPAQDAGNPRFLGEPIVPPILLPTALSSSSAITATPSPQLDTHADIHGVLSVDQLPLSNRRGAPSTGPEEDASYTQDRDTNVQLLPFRSDSQTVSSGLHDIHSPSAPPPVLLPSTPISGTSQRIPQTPPSCLLLAHLTSPPSPAHPQSRTFVPYPDQPPSPKVFCDLTHEQLRLAIKQHNADVDARSSSHGAVSIDKNNVVFHPDTNDNGTYATGSDPFRKRKKRRRPTPFFPEGSSSTGETVSDLEGSTEDEIAPNEDDEDEKPEPQVEVDFEELVEEAHLAKLRWCRRARSAVIPSMVLAKPEWPEPETKPPVVAQRSTSTPSSPALSPISEEESSGDTSGVSPYTVVFVGANGSPEEVWKLPVPAFMLIKSSVARQPQAQKLRIRTHRVDTPRSGRSTAWKGFNI